MSITYSYETDELVFDSLSVQDLLRNRLVSPTMRNQVDHYVRSLANRGDLVYEAAFWAHQLEPQLNSLTSLQILQLWRQGRIRRR